MNENLKTFFKQLAENPELASRLSACKTPDEAYAVAGGEASGFTKEEFVSAMEAVKASVQENGELSDEDLRKMAGGDINQKDLAESFAVSMLSTSLVITTGGFASAAAI